LKSVATKSDASGQRLIVRFQRLAAAWRLKEVMDASRTNASRAAHGRDGKASKAHWRLVDIEKRALRG